MKLKPQQTIFSYSIRMKALHWAKRVSQAISLMKFWVKGTPFLVLISIFRIKEKDDRISVREIKVCKSACQRKYRKRQKLKNRSDVVNKSLLRAIKKYFVNIFKEEFPQSRFRSALKWARQFYGSLSILLWKSLTAIWSQHNWSRSWEYLSTASFINGDENYLISKPMKT